MEKLIGKFLVLAFLFVILVTWLTNNDIKQNFSSSTSAFYSFGQIFALIGIALFSLTLFLNTRLKLLEDIFGGLNKVFPVHHNLGRIAFIFIVFHPVLLFISYFTVSVDSGLNFVFGPKGLGLVLGISAYLLFILIILITLYIKLAYHIWRFIHQFIGVAFILAVVHMLILGSDVRSPFFYVMMALGITAYFYKTIFSRFLIKKYAYRIKKINKHTKNIYELVLEPEGKKINFLPGQFVFIKTENQKFYEEQHPFSFTSSPSEKTVRLFFKVLGDFTGRLKDEKTGTKVWLEGPYGKFIKKDNDNKQIWIAGGIGITPFLSMKESAISTKTSLFYSVSNKSEAIMTEKLKEKNYTDKKFEFILWQTEKKGRLSAKSLALAKNIKNSIIYICGPLSMIKTLKQQFFELGIDEKQIFTEEFTLMV